jgi:ribose transport system substrate-binding protein
MTNGKLRRPYTWLAAAAALALMSLLASCSNSDSSVAASSKKDASANVPAAVSSFLAQGYKGTFSAPPSTGPAAVKGKNVWVISCGQVAASCAVPADAAMAAGAAAGWHMHLYDAKLDPANYTTGIDEAIADKANGIVNVVVDCDLARAPLLQAKAAGIKDVGIDSFDCNDPLDDTGSPVYSTFVKFNGEPTAGDAFQEWDALKMAWLIAQTNGKAKVVATYEPGFLISLHRAAGMKAEIALCKQCSLDLVAFSPTDLEGNGAQEKLQSALLQNPDTNAVLIGTDSYFAQFANAALRNVGYSHLKIMGGECIGTAATDAIRAGGPEQACVVMPAQWEGWAAVDELNRQFADPGSAPVDEGLGFLVVDKTHNLPKSGAVQLPVNFIADYEKVWAG